MSVEMQRFPIRFTGANRAMVVLGITPAASYIDVDDEVFTVRLSWSFRATVPRASVRGVDDDHGKVRGWGAHGWRGVWLVNGSSSRIVRVDLDPPARARVCGVPVRLRTLRVAVDDPVGLTRALTPLTDGAVS
jgi:hypothetical protein